MKLLNALLFCSIITFSFACGTTHNEKKESEKNIARDYWISSTEKDPNLDENHAQFELEFDPSTTRSHANIELSCNGVISRFQVDSTYEQIMVSPGSYVFQVYRGQGYNEITTDSIVILPGHKTVIHFHFRDPEQEMHLKKPVIYTYSDVEKAVDITIRPKGELTFTYPLAEAGKWSGTVHADGSFTSNGKNYPYLFWEGERKQSLQPDFSSGFVVNRDEVVPFLEKQLTAMGLNEKEQTDFITFWGPIMTQSESGFAHFVFNEDYDELATLEISPKPDHMFRVYLLWTPLQAGQHISPKRQTIPKMTREGFYVIEWGGSEVPLLNQTVQK